MISYEPLARRCRVHKPKPPAELQQQPPENPPTFKSGFDRQLEGEYMRDSVWAWGITSN